jgi:uncharacterized FlaG/YvyC family protein
MELIGGVEGIAPAAVVAAPPANVGAAVANGGAAAPQHAAMPPSAGAVQAAVAQLNAFMRSSDRSIEFAVDAASGLTVVNVRDSDTGETIRQIPSDEVIRIARQLRGKASPDHLLFHMKV